MTARPPAIAPRLRAAPHRSPGPRPRILLLAALLACPALAQTSSTEPPPAPADQHTSPPAAPAATAIPQPASSPAPAAMPATQTAPPPRPPEPATPPDQPAAPSPTPPVQTAPQPAPPLPPTGTQPPPASSANTRLPAAPDTTDERKLARSCVVPESLRSPPTRLPGLTAALVRGKGDLLVLVLGSDSPHADSTAPAASGRRTLRREPPPRQTSLTTLLQAQLGRELPPIPGRQIRVESVGRQNSSVGEQAALIGRQIVPRKPALVIWNLGRADTRRGLPPARMAQALDRGLKQLRAQKVDTIVLDPPYHPQFEALYRTDDYRQYLRWTINLHDQPMMRRYDMIDYWASTGRIDLDSGDAERQARAVVFTETCTAWQLARMIDRALN